MARLKDVAKRVSDLFNIDPNDITVDPDYNIRSFDSANDDEDRLLKESIRVSGVRTPVSVRMDGENVILIAGHRRVAAVKELIAEGVEIKAIPAVPEPRGTNDAERVLDLITSNSGKPLSQEQKAQVLKRLLAFGWTEEDMAEKSGMSLPTVRGLLELAGADTEIQQMVREGEVSATTAIQTIRKEGSKAKTTLKKAAKLAQASGKKKITAKTLKRVKAHSQEHENGVGEEIGGSEIIHARYNDDGKYSVSKRDMVKTLRSILNAETIDIAHHLARECLGIKQKALDPEQNAEVLKEFKITGGNKIDDLELGEMKLPADRLEVAY